MKTIAFIGGGCGSCTSAFFVDKWLNDNNYQDFAITIYEKANNLGGRLQQIKVNDQVCVDLGGSIYHIGVNPNVVETRRAFIEKMYRTEVDDNWKESVQLTNIYDNVESLGIWNGEKFVYLGPRRIGILTALQKFFDDYCLDIFSIGSFFGYINHKIQNLRSIISIISTYGLSTIQGIQKFKDQEGKNFTKLFQDYTSTDYVESYSAYLPKHLIYTNAREYLTAPSATYNISTKFLTEVIEPVTRNIYSQNLDQYHSLAMVTTILSGDSSKLRTFKNGNGNFFESIVKSIDPRKCSIRLDDAIIRIEYKNNKYIITSKNSTQIYDFVVIGVPIEKCEIEFINLPQIDQYKHTRKFIPVSITVISGQVNPKFFGYEKIDQVPQVIRTTDSSNQFCKFLTFQALWYDNVRKQKIYKIQSFKELDVKDLNQMFTKINFHFKYNFDYGYPCLRPLYKDEKLPVRLEKGLFYLNSVESLSSAMEASCWSGRTIANLMVNDVLNDM